MSVPHPGPVRRFGKSQGSLLFDPKGSPSVPKVAVNGTPSLTLRMLPNCHPFINQATGPESDLSWGTSQVPLITKVRPMLKSERPRLLFKSNHCGLPMALANVSPTTLDELVSILLAQVKEPWSCKPWLILFCTPTSRAS